MWSNSIRHCRVARMVVCLALWALVGASQAAYKHFGSLDEVIVAFPSLSSFAAVAKAGNLGELLDECGGCTVLAPTNGAFDGMPDEQRAKLSSEGEVARQFLLRHVVLPRLKSGDAPMVGSFEALDGTRLHIDTEVGFTVQGVVVVRSDIGIGGSVLHVIDEVLAP